MEYSNTSLGTTLRECRTISGLSLNDVAEATDLTITYLLDIENEGAGPTEDVLRRLMRVYGPAIRNIHVPPGQDRRERAASTERSEIDWISFMLRKDQMTNRELLSEVATAVRTLRRLSETVAVQMRQPEADLLVSMLDLTDDDLALDIMNEFKLSVAQTRDFIGGAVKRAERRAAGNDSEFLRRLSGVRYPPYLAEVR